MKLIPYTFNGSAINDGTAYIAKLIETSHNQGAADVIELSRTNAFPLYAGKELQSKNLFLVIDMQGTIASQIENIKKIFDISDHSQYTFVCKDENNSNKQWYINATPINEEWTGNTVTYTLNADDPIWRSIVQGTLSVSMNSDSTFGTIAVGGNKYAQPVISITPTSSKGTAGYAYRRFVTLYNKGTIDYGKYPVNLADNGSGTAFISGSTLVAGTKLLSSGTDLRVFVDGQQVNRYLGGTVNSGTTLIWANINLPAGQEMTLGTAIGTADTAGTIWFQQTTSNQNALKSIPSQGLLHSGSEIFYYGTKDWQNYCVKNVTRAVKLTAVGSHSIGGTFHWLPHDIWVAYGNSAATSITMDSDYGPAFGQSASNNNQWKYFSFGKYNGKPSAMWKPGKPISQGGESNWYTGNQGTTETDPFTDIGCAIKAWKNGNRWQSEKAEINWMAYLPAGATALVYSIDKYMATTNSWPEIISGFCYSNGYGITKNNLATPAVAGSWYTNSGTITPTESQRYWYLWFKGSLPGASNNVAYLECNEATFSLDKFPFVGIGSEENNYHLELYIRNSNTNEKIKLETVMGVGETLTVNCANKTVELSAADTGTQTSNLINAIELDSVRDEWLTMQPGANNIISFGENGTTGLDIELTFEERQL